MENNLAERVGLMELRPIVDLPGPDQLAVLAIRNDPEVRRHMYTTHEISREEHLDWIERLKNDKQTRAFGVFLSGTLVGAASLSSISAEHKRADWGFYIDPAARGVGTALGFTVLDHAFESLDKLNGEVLDINERSIAFHEKLGFKREGVRRRHILREGHAHDVVLMGLTAAEWQASRTNLLEGKKA